MGQESLVPQDPIRQRFEENLPLLASVCQQVMRQNRTRPLDLVYAGAISLWRLCCQYPEGCGVSFGEFAEVALLGELAGYLQYPMPTMVLPEPLRAFGPQLLEIARSLGDYQLVPYAASEEFVTPIPEGGGGIPIAQILGRYWGVIVTLAVVCEIAVLGLSLKEPKAYKATTVINTGIGAGGNLAGQQFDWFRAGTLMGNVVELMKSKSVLESTAKVLGLPLDAERMGKRIQIDRVSNTDLLRITATANSATLAADIANTQVSEFVRYYTSLQSHDARSADAFIQQQVAQSEKKLRESEERLKKFKANNIPEAQVKLVERLTEMQLERDTLVQGMAAAEAGLGATEAELGRLKKDGSRLSDAASSREVLAASERLQTLEQNLADIEASDGANSLMAQRLKRQIQAARNQVRSTTAQVAGADPAIADAIAKRTALKIELAQSQAKLAALDRSIYELKPNAQSASQAEISLKQLQREVALNEAEYQRLVERSGQTNLALHGASNLTISVVDPAAPPTKPVSRRIPMKLAIGLLVSLTLGCIISYALYLIQGKPVESV